MTSNNIKSIGIARVGFHAGLAAFGFAITFDVATAQTLSATQPVYVLSESRSLPPANSAWKGEAPHVFLDGQATLFCGTHGTMVGSSEPPRQKGQSSTISYDAVFTGDLNLQPPLVEATQSFHINQSIRMTERYTLQSTGRNSSQFVTELTAVDFSGTDFPPGIRVRESPVRQSMGTTTINRNRKGAFAIKSEYAVWLEFSADSGRNWYLASDAVTMRLAPEVRTARISEKGN